MLETQPDIGMRNAGRQDIVAFQFPVRLVQHPAGELRRRMHLHVKAHGRVEYLEQETQLPRTVPVQEIAQVKRRVVLNDVLQKAGTCFRFHRGQSFVGNGRQARIHGLRQRSDPFLRPVRVGAAGQPVQPVDTGAAAVIPADPVRRQSEKHFLHVNTPYRR